MARGRLTLYLLLFFLITINYADRIALSIGAAPIAAEFHISPVGMGFLFSCFLWSYVLCLIPWGMITDRIGIRAVGGIGIALWSAATVLTGFAPGLAWLFGARLAMGAGEASAFPAAGRAVREWVPASEYGLASMLVISGGYAGPAIGSVLFGWFATSLGWRGGFVALGCIGFLWLLASLMWFRKPSSSASNPAPAPVDHRPSGLRALLASSTMWGLLLTQGACVYSHYLFLTWLPSYLQLTRHLTILKTGLFSAIPFAVTVICSLAIAALSDRLLRGRDGRTGQRRLMVAGMMLVSTVVLLTPLVTNIWLILVLVTVSLTGTSAATGLNAALLTDLLPSSSNAGTANSVLVVGGNAFGMLAPIVTGYVIASTGHYDAAWVISGALLIAGMIISMTMTRRPIRAGADVIDRAPSAASA
ncbi:MFS transporter [Acidisphaera sp. S103]|uniref:MFS transporter n=1 Tax=Acidisphaera sp. S103 TaxID=1747223 RepID=UPI00131B5863|nr:MFS transporter [Acidisphaera sp. S103]